MTQIRRDEMTKAEKVISWLIEHQGAREERSPSRKYRKFVTPGSTYWIARNGAVRGVLTVSLHFIWRRTLHAIWRWIGIPRPEIVPVITSKEAAERIAPSL
jgi:hypothetical protein